MTQATTGSSGDVDDLAGRLQRLGLARHPMGLRAGAARRFSEAVRSTGDVAAAIRTAGGDLRVASIIEQARPGDALRLVSGLLPAMGEVAAHRRALQAAATYPLALLACLAVVSTAIYGVSAPAVAALASMNGTSAAAARLGEGAGIIASMALLLALAVAVRSRIRIPLLSGSGVVLDRFLVLETVARLHEQAVSLPLAFRAAASWVTGAARREVHQVAEALERGGTLETGGRLLDAATAGLLISAAARGVVSPVLSALAQQARLAGAREIPDEVSRIHLAALLVTGIALAVVGMGFFGTYVAAATG